MSRFRTDGSNTLATVSVGAVHPGIESALTYLTVILAEPASGKVDDDLADDVAEVVSALVDVHPPLPPLQYPAQGADDDRHALALIAHAKRRLQLTAISSDDRSERLRAAVASNRLHALLVGWVP